MEVHERVKNTGKSKYADKCDGILTIEKNSCNICGLKNMCSIKMYGKNNMKCMRDKWS